MKDGYAPLFLAFVMTLFAAIFGTLTIRNAAKQSGLPLKLKRS